MNSELRSLVKVEVAVLGSPSLTDLMVSVDVKHATLEKKQYEEEHVFGCTANQAGTNDQHS